MANDKGLVNVFLIEKLYFEKDDLLHVYFDNNLDQVNQIIFRELYDTDIQMITVSRCGSINTYSLDRKIPLYTYRYEGKSLEQIILNDEHEKIFLRGTEAKKDEDKEP